MSVSLLPSSHSEFQLKDYWEKFFQKRKAPFEWYGEYLDLCHILHKYIKASNTILVVGCGNSKLSEDLYDVGFTSIDNIDISEVVIKQMTSKNRTKRPEMTYTVMDIFEMTYNDSTFDCVIDKGTLDAVCVNSGQETIDKVKNMFSEISRVLKSNGRYICISLSQEHVLNQLVAAHSQGWIIRVHVVKCVGEKVGVASALPVFIFVMTKMASPAIQIFEYVNEDEKCIRCEDDAGIIEFVRNCQQYALVLHHLGSMHMEEQVCLDLWSGSNNIEPRFTLRVVDLPKKKALNGQFAIFLVPQGRETNWLFSSSAGSTQLAESAGYERLVIVTLHRGHTYQSLDKVKEEISTKAMELSQDSLPDRIKCPVLSLAEGVGSRTVLLESSSSSSGGFVVEESQDEEERGLVRRLVFLESPHLAQTEILMINKSDGASKRKGKKGRQHKNGGKLFDFSELMFPYHKLMLSSLALIGGEEGGKRGRNPTGAALDILIVGLGGGALPMFIKKHIPMVCQDVVDLDGSMIQVAIDWFGLEADQIVTGGEGEKILVHRDRGKLNVIQGDGVEHIMSLSDRKQANTLYHVIILDVDNKDAGSGLSSPPLSFTTPQFLQAAKSLLHPNGM
uniref:Methyltransferase domain-containing protein n=1 Tax=Amphimedon queenslandica TaxID=400682 RepID=A0A1X7V9F0_AMPQE